MASSALRVASLANRSSARRDCELARLFVSSDAVEIRKPNESRRALTRVCFVDDDVAASLEARFELIRKPIWIPAHAAVGCSGGIPSQRAQVAIDVRLRRATGKVPKDVRIVPCEGRFVACNRGRQV